VAAVVSQMGYIPYEIKRNIIKLILNLYSETYIEHKLKTYIVEAEISGKKSSPSEIVLRYEFNLF